MASATIKSPAMKGMALPAKPVYEKPWFEAAFLLGCLGLAALLHMVIAHSEFLSSSTVDAIAMAKLLAAGEFADVFAKMTHPPIYPMLLAGIMKLKETTHVPVLMKSFEQMNLILYAVSIGLVYLFCKQHLQKPWTYIVTLLYLLAPTTVAMAQNVDANMTYTVTSMSALLIIDRYFGKKIVHPGFPAPSISRTELIVCGLFIGVSILTRQIGYILLAAFFFVMLKKFGLKKSFSVLVAVVLALSPFIGRDIYHVLKEPGIYTNPSTQLIQKASSSSDKGFSLLKKQTDTLFSESTKHTVGELNLGIVPQLLGPSENALWLAHLDFSHIVWLRWTLGALLLLGLLYGMAQYSGIGALYLTTYAVSAFVIFPKHGISLAPVLPLLLIYSYFGLHRIAEWAKKVHIPLMKIAGPVLTGVILICTISTHLTYQFQRGVSHPQFFTAQQNLAMQKEPEAVAQLAVVQPTEKDLSKKQAEKKAIAAALSSATSDGGRNKALQWLSLNAEKDARIATPRPKAASKITEGEQSPAMARELRKYDYVVEEGVSMLSGRKNHNPGLKLVYTDPTAGIRIWRIRPENLPLSD